MKNYCILFLFLFSSSITFAQEYVPTAIEKNNQAVKLMFRPDSLEKAILLLDEAIAIDSSYVLAYTHKSQCLDRLGRVQEALQTCLSAEKYALENPYYYTLKGVYLEKSGKVEVAHKAYQKSFMLFGEELKKKPDANVCINYIMAKYLYDGKEMSGQEMESLMPVTFTASEKKDVLDFFKTVSLVQAKQGLLGKPVDTRKK
ncbi:tetratricopeptide repeat protein [Bacteroides acidifaciens]|jgi:tetratricopeptide (TPR) repeat protein|uniref:tetratricopeptide repeat protein n=2 Tax=Bacteroides acidifaciens TaxID=85831 RepID=UPI002587DEFF|nr:tetratricopeptide repeat protein [Bacteroides acidifaciens]